MSGLGGKVAIIGTGTIKFGENFHQSLSDMIFEAVNLAMADAKIESRQLQAAWFGCYEPMLYGFEGNSGTFVSDPLNLFPIPVTRVAAYCATGIEAVRNAALAVASGEYDLVLAVGAEKMREVPSRGSLVAQAVNRGHPVLAKGRTAIHDQLLGRAGKMQVAGADMGLAHNLGGPGAFSAVAVFSQP
jgi:acetyl-CoA C-acetyltransferase